MSDKRIEKIKQLIEEGKSFDYDNFSLKGELGIHPRLKWNTLHGKPKQKISFFRYLERPALYLKLTRKAIRFLL